MVIEPKGKFGQAIETVLNKISLYEYDMKKVKQHAEELCIPFATLRYVLRGIIDNRKHLLIAPINDFFNQKNNMVQPLKEVVRRTRKKKKELLSVGGGVRCSLAGNQRGWRGDWKSLLSSGSRQDVPWRVTSETREVTRRACCQVGQGGSR